MCVYLTHIAHKIMISDHLYCLKWQSLFSFFLFCEVNSILLHKISLFVGWRLTETKWKRRGRETGFSYFRSSRKRQRKPLKKMRLEKWKERKTQLDLKRATRFPCKRSQKRFKYLSYFWKRVLFILDCSLLLAHSMLTILKEDLKYCWIFVDGIRLT